MKAWSVIKDVALWVAIIGAINWGLVGAFDFNLVSSLLSGWFEKAVYILAGVGGILLLQQKL